MRNRDSQPATPTDQLTLDFHEAVVSDADPEPPALQRIFEEAVASLLGGALSRLFDRMAIAEDEIDRATSRFPSSRDQIDQSFIHLCPTPLLAGLSHTVYRAHVRELVGRVAAGKPVEPGTKAEVLAALCVASQSAPLNATGFLLYCRLFRGVLPDARDVHTSAPNEGEEFFEEEANALFELGSQKLRSPRGHGLN